MSFLRPPAGKEGSGCFLNLGWEVEDYFTRAAIGGTGAVKAGGNYAASLCENYTGGGYTDWYLPSLIELRLIYRNLFIAGMGSFGGDYYWSSTEHSDIRAWYQEFIYGNWDPDMGLTKDNNFYFRPVRAF